TAAITAPLAIKAALAAQPDPLLAGVQALVNEIRQGLGKCHIPVASLWALHQAADRLEALPGIQAVHNEYWSDCRRAMGERCGPPRVLRLARGLPS
ncbi:MAG: hypothetical protein IID48_21970, partial [Proteobacteria bacterium]|nr:hypothetical protein [Pseudomonadota bacterium]